MSGSLAARYIAGLPYDPSLGVGQYARGPRAPTPTGTQVPGSGAFTVPNIDATGQAVRVPGAAATVATTGGDVAGGQDTLLAAALGLLPYLPDAYSAIDGLVNPAEAPAQAASGGLDAGTFTGPGGVQVPNAALGGLGTNWDSVFEQGSWGVDDAATQALLDAPLPAGDQFAGAAGDVAAANAGAGDAAGSSGWFNNPLGLPAEAMTVSDMGLGSVGGIDIANSLAYAPAAVFAMGTPAFAKPGGELGGQIGTGIGTAIGGLIGGPWGAAAGAVAGGAIGGQIGPAPTVGRNFSSIGTFGGDGGLSWGNSGGDNGASAADADPFANWFAQNLQQQAAAQGLAFNPNMAGAQIRVGGYDNFNRTGLSPAGGYFYDITNQGGQFGGSPEQYALRPSDDFAGDPFSARQADAFTTNVLADLAARNVFTPGGAATGGQGDLMGTLGTGYGWYGGLGSDYSQIEYGGSGGFNDILGGRQNAITGYVNQQQAQSAANNAARQVLGSSFDPFNSYDPNFGWQAMAANMPAGAGQGPVSWQTDPAAMAAQQWGGGVIPTGPIQVDGGA